MVTDILKVLWYMQDCHCNPFPLIIPVIHRRRLLLRIPNIYWAIPSITVGHIITNDIHSGNIMFNQTCATRYVIRILVINAKQRQQTGKQNFPKCGAVSGFSLQNGIFPKFSFIYLIGFIFINKGELYAIHFISHHCHFSNLCIM